jgi:Na+-translocating ferredoxin:NAD+ oxidoreductase RnfG subunit
METSAVILLVVSASISFALGRTIMHFRNKKKNADAQKRAAEALRDTPPEAESKNKSKRKRQLQQIEKSGKDRV